MNFMSQFHVLSAHFVYFAQTFNS